MNQLHKYKDYSPNEINENFNFDIIYEIQGRDAIGDIYNPQSDKDDANYNPFDLKEMVKLLTKKTEQGVPNLFIVKVTSERLPDEEIERIKIQIEGDKYNI